MDYQKLHEIVRDTPPKEWLINEDEGIYTCTSDLNVRLVAEREFMDESHKFRESWATSLSDKHAYKRWVDLYYGSSWVQRFTFVVIDNQHASIPLPKPGNPMTISAFEAHIGRIINQPNSQFDDYIGRLKIQIQR